MPNFEVDVESLELQADLDEALFSAVFNENIPAVRHLLANGANPSQKSTRQGNYLNTPLHIAAWHGCTQLCSILLAANADTEQENKFHNTPLMFASYYGKDSAIMELLKGGANILTLSSGSGLTALHKACMQGLPQTVALLLRYGAVVRTCDLQDRTPLDVIGLDSDRQPPPSAQECDEIRALLTNPDAATHKLFSPYHEHDLQLSLVGGQAAGSKASYSCAHCEADIHSKSLLHTCTDCTPPVFFCPNCVTHEDVYEIRSASNSGPTGEEPQQKPSLWTALCRCL